MNQRSGPARTVREIVDGFQCAPTRWYNVILNDVIEVFEYSLLDDLPGDRPLPQTNVNQIAPQAMAAKGTARNASTEFTSTHDDKPVGEIFRITSQTLASVAARYRSHPVSSGDTLCSAATKALKSAFRIPIPTIPDITFVFSRTIAHTGVRFQRLGQSRRMTTARWVY